MMSLSNSLPGTQKQAVFLNLGDHETSCHVNVQGGNIVPLLLLL